MNANTEGSLNEYYQILWKMIQGLKKYMMKRVIKGSVTGLNIFNIMC